MDSSLILADLRKQFGAKKAVLYAEELAIALHRTANAIYALKSRGTLPVPCIKVGGRLAVSIYDVADWLAAVEKEASFGGLMKLLRMMKVVPPVMTVLGAIAWAVSGPARAEPITPESVLTALVQISTQEDLVDEKRVGDLLGLSIVMIPEQPFALKDGRIATGSTAQVPADPGYFSTGGTYFYYRQLTSPTRLALVMLKFDPRKLCIDYKEAISAFGQHGEVRESPPPMSAPWPQGVPRQPDPPKAQPSYGYTFKGKLSFVALTFAYSECLIGVQIRQPVSDR